MLGEGGVGVDAGRDVGHDPDVLVGGAGGGELGAEPGDLLGGWIVAAGFAVPLQAAYFLDSKMSWRTMRRVCWMGAGRAML